MGDSNGEGMTREDGRHDICSTGVVSKDRGKTSGQLHIGYSRNGSGSKSCGVLLGGMGRRSVTFGESGNGVLKSSHFMGEA